MTVKELFELCKREINNGKGDNDIVLCAGIDVPEFHPLEKGFSLPIYNSGSIYDFLEDWEADEDCISVLN